MVNWRATISRASKCHVAGTAFLMVITVAKFAVSQVDPKIYPVAEAREYTWVSKDGKQIAYENARKQKKADEAICKQIHDERSKGIHTLDKKIKHVQKHQAFDAAETMIQEFKNSGGSFKSAEEEVAIKRQLRSDIRAGRCNPRSDRGYTVVVQGGTRFKLSQFQVAVGYAVVELMKKLGYNIVLK